MVWLGIIIKVESTKSSHSHRQAIYRAPADWNVELKWWHFNIMSSYYFEIQLATDQYLDYDITLLFWIWISILGRTTIIFAILNKFFILDLRGAMHPQL